MPRSFWILALLPLALAACDDAGEADLEETPAVLDEPDGTAPAAAPGEATLPAEQDADRDYLVQMIPVDGGDLTGTVGFTPAGGQTEVTVSISGGAAGATSQGHIHRGDDCEQIGEVVQPLPEVEVGAAGAAGNVPMEMQTIMDGNHLVVYHEPGGDPGAPALCADVPLLPPNLPPS